jgi:hypothetical protein
MRPSESRETGAASAAEFVEEPTCLEGALAGALGGSVTDAGDFDGSEDVDVAGDSAVLSKTDWMASMA